MKKRISGKLIQEQRVEHGQTHLDVSRLFSSGTTAPRVRDWENGSVKPRKRTLKILGKHWKVPIAAFYTGQKKKSSSTIFPPPVSTSRPNLSSRRSYRVCQRPAKGSVGKRIDNLRQEHGLTRKALSEKSGITQWLLGAIEHDGRKVSPDEKTRLVKALGFTDWRELMGTHSHHSHAVDNMGFLSEETKNGMKVDLDAELERLRILRTAIDSQE